MRDTIYRADAIETVRNVSRDLIQDKCMPLGCATDFTDALSALPSAEAVQGEWIGYNADKADWLRTDGTPIFLVCDKCHGTVINNGSAHWNFCPNCGAMMMTKGGGSE